MEDMESKNKIVSPNHILIKGLQRADIKSIKEILKEEGCPSSENLFSDNEMGISLDVIQSHIAKANKTDKKASADLLVCINGNKYLLADAKFKARTVRNISLEEAKDKLRESKSIVLSMESCGRPFYILFTGKVLTNSSYNIIKRMFHNNPGFEFKTAKTFYELFEH